MLGGVFNFQRLSWRRPPLRAQLARPVPLPRRVWGSTPDAPCPEVEWGPDGTTCTRGKPWRGGGAASRVVAGAAAGPDSFISRCPGLPPHMAPGRSAGLPLLGSAAELSTAGGWSEWGAEWAVPPAVLEVCEALRSWHPSPPSKSLPSLSGLFMTRAGRPVGGGRAEGAGQPQLWMGRQNLSSGCWRVCSGPPRAYWSLLKGCVCFKGSVLLLSCNQGCVSSPSCVHTGLGLPREGAVSTYTEGCWVAP